MKTWRLLLAVSALFALTGRAEAQECAAPKPEWVFCDDFESPSDQNGNLGLWDDQGLGPQNLVIGSGAMNVHSGTRSLEITAHKGTDTGGGPTKWFLPGYDEIYVRFWTRFAADYHYLHHMVFIGASEAQNKWAAFGTAGCRPSGSNFFVTQIEPFSENDRHPPPGAWGFYTYSTDMHCDPGATCANYADPAQICSDCATKGSPCQNGLECCWGTNNVTSPTVSPPLGAWTCVEARVQANTGGQSNGTQTLFIDGKQVGTWSGIRFRSDDALKINSLGLWHYVTDDVYAPGQTQETLWFDDVVVSTAPIGCGAGAPGGADSGPTSSGGRAGSGSGGTSGVAAGGSPAGSGGAPRAAGGNASGGFKSTVDGGSALGDAGASKAGAGAKDGGGCGCRTAHRPADRSRLAAMALVSALVMRRRRRSAQHGSPFA